MCGVPEYDGPRGDLLREHQEPGGGADTRHGGHQGQPLNQGGGHAPSPPQHLLSYLCFEILSQAKEEVFTVDKLTGNVYGTYSFFN